MGDRKDIVKCVPFFSGRRDLVVEKICVLGSMKFDLNLSYYQISLCMLRLTSTSGVLPAM